MDLSLEWKSMGMLSPAVRRTRFLYGCFFSVTNSIYLSQTVEAIFFSLAGFRQACKDSLDSCMDGSPPHMDFWEVHENIPSLSPNAFLETPTTIFRVTSQTDDGFNSRNRSLALPLT